MALTVHSVVSGIGELGLQRCLVRADLDIDILAPTAATIAILSSAILAAGMTAFAGTIAAALGSAAAANPIRVMAIVILLEGIFAVPQAQAVREFRQDTISLGNVIGFALSAVLLIALAKSGSGAMAFAWARVAGQFAGGWIVVAAAPRYYRPGLTGSALSTIFRLGIPLTFANLAGYILNNVDYAFIAHFLGSAPLGVYVLAYNVSTWPSGVLGAVIIGVSMPAFSRVKDDHAALRNAIVKALRAVALVAIPMCAMTIALARPLVLTLYGDKWAASAHVLVILSLYGAISVICTLFANALAGLGHNKAFLALQLIWIGTLIPAMALGVHDGGVVGAAYAHVIIIAPIVLPTYLLVMTRITNVGFMLLAKAVFPALLASSGAALAASSVASQFSSPLAELVAGMAAGGAIYIICIGRQAIGLFGSGRAAERVLHFYGAADRVAGLCAQGCARHRAVGSRRPRSARAVGRHRLGQ